MDYELVRDAKLPEWAWWEFDTGDFGSSRMPEAVDLTSGTDPKVDRFLLRNGGKLLLYHGWVDRSAAHPCFESVAPLFGAGAAIATTPTHESASGSAARRASCTATT